MDLIFTLGPPIRHQEGSDELYIFARERASNWIQNMHVCNFVWENAGWVDVHGDFLVIVFDVSNECKFLFTFTRANNIVEIYDVCTARQWRRRGIATHYLSLFAHEAAKANHRVWLGVNALEALPALNVYTRIGFVGAEWGNTTPLGTLFETGFVGLTYREQSTTQERQEANERAKQLLINQL